MSTHRRPEVFISATSADLRSCREMIKQALLTLQCVPVEQTNFPPDYRTVKDMLRAKIETCDAVIHVAGIVYGAEPKERAPGAPRRSYTQMEYDLAKELKKELYVFVCGDDFLYDEHAREDEAKTALQRTHRELLLGLDTLRYRVASPADLNLLVHRLQILVQQLTEELARQRREFVAIQHQQNERLEKSERRTAALEAELEEQRRYIRSIAEAFTRQQAEFDAFRLAYAEKPRLTDSEKFDQAFAVVATHEKITESQLRANIDGFVTAVGGNRADLYDQALADFAQGKFAAAAQNAWQAAEAARQQGTSARERLAHLLHARALQAERKYPAAVAAFESAMAITSRTEDPLAWTEQQTGLGRTLLEWAQSSAGTEIGDLVPRSISAFRTALEVLPREQSPRDWAMIQHNLSVALSYQAKLSGNSERGPLLRNAENACRAAAAAFTPEAFPAEWTQIQNSLAGLLHQQAVAATEPQRSQLLEDAAAIFHHILQLRPREQFPRDWAIAQVNLGIVLASQGGGSFAQAKPELNAEAIAQYRKAIEMINRQDFPRPWAAAQLGLAEALRRRFWISPGGDMRSCLAESVTACRAALGTHTRAHYPQEWAETQNQLADSLADYASILTATEVPAVFAEVIAAHQAALEVFTPAEFPRQWTNTQEELARKLWLFADKADSRDRARLFGEAADCFRRLLQATARETDPKSWADHQISLAKMLEYQAEASSEADAAPLLVEAAAARQTALESTIQKNTADERRKLLTFIMIPAYIALTIMAASFVYSLLK